MNLLDIFEQREPYQQAIDALEQRRIEQVREKIAVFKKSLAKATDDEMRQAIKGRLQELEKELAGYYSVKSEAQQPQQPPAKGLLKGKDLVTPQQRVAGATPSKPGVAGAVKDVAGGIKRWLKGEPDQGPTYEAEQPAPNPRALGVANFQRLVKANMGNVPTVSFEFIRPEENFKLDQRGLDLISDYYDGLENDQAKNYFIYRVLPSGDETLKVLKQLGWTPAQPVQQELPGIPQQGELPLNEKKKSAERDNIEAGDVKVSRELQKLRAQYPAATSDTEAIARAEIDSSERSRQQIAAIRGANEKQDALLKQLVALDREQGQEINNLDQENDSLEQQLAQVQNTNDRLEKTIGQMSGTKRSAKTSNGTINLMPGAPADTKEPTKVKAKAEPAPPKVEPQAEPIPTKAPSSAMAAMAQQIQGLNKAAPSIRPAPGIKAANEPELDLESPPKVSGSDVKEHGGGIGPRQHWQSLMKEEELVEGIKDTASATAVIACLLTGGSLQGCATAPQQTSAQQVLKTGQDIGRTVQTAKKITRAGTEEEVRQELRNILRGISGRPEELNHSNILRIWRRVNNPEPQPQNEAKEPTTKQEYDRAVDSIMNQLAMERNSAVRQMLNAQLKVLQDQGRVHGWHKDRVIREDTAALAAEDAILKRIFVKHRDLMMEYGPDKITQAAEAVAYNVGDIAHITDEQINEWVDQVEYILGARP